VLLLKAGMELPSLSRKKKPAPGEAGERSILYISQRARSFVIEIHGFAVKIEFFAILQG
jgi:hypothetical protein